MDRRVFGRTGLEIPRIVFGATILGNLFQAVPASTKREIVRAWLAQVAPPVVIDSAGKYGAGMSLEVIGRELTAANVAASDVIISNKLGWRRVPLTGSEPTFEPGAWFDLEYDAQLDISYDGIRRCWEEGNQLLGNYRAKLVSVHDPDEYLQAARSPEERQQRLRDVIEAYRALVDLKSSGEVAGVGIGAKNWQTIRELDQHCDFDWVMIANSFTIMHHPPELVAFITALSARNIGVINSALFHGGFLTGGNFFDYRRLDTSSAEDRARLAWRDRFGKVCQAHAITPFEVGVAFGLSHPGVTAVALSSSRPERVAEHVQAVERRIPSDLWRDLLAANLIRDDYQYAHHLA